MKRPFFLYPLLMLHVFLGVSAFAGGGMLLKNEKEGNFWNTDFFCGKNHGLPSG
ncbi:hypothetical protein [Litoribacter populi]|uniref:hypothetical protein n=1 Tax=Litoribacter populi TaxID=2598460 RepID=UPI00163DA867|nr:hypothetical protein [Litoribacter populi]